MNECVDVQTFLKQTFGIFICFDRYLFHLASHGEALSGVLHPPMPSDSCPGCGLNGSSKTAAEPVAAILIIPS